MLALCYHARRDATVPVRRRCAHLTNVTIECADVATDLREGAFDLIVFSQIGYYFPAAQDY